MGKTHSVKKNQIKEVKENSWISQDKMPESDLPKAVEAIFKSLGYVRK